RHQDGLQNRPTNSLGTRPFRRTPCQGRGGGTRLIRLNSSGSKASGCVGVAGPAWGFGSIDGGGGGGAGRLTCSAGVGSGRSGLGGPVRSSPKEPGVADGGRTTGGVTAVGSPCSCGLVRTVRQTQSSRVRKAAA